MYCPENLNQTLCLLIYDNGIYQLSETVLEKSQPMYMGNDRIKLEAFLRRIKRDAELKKLKNLKLMVYKINSAGITFLPQSNFYNIISSK